MLSPLIRGSNGISGARHYYFLYTEQPFKTGLGTSLTEEED